MTVTGSIDLANDVCIGVDVGGTFTDAVLTDGVGIWRAKAPTTPGDLGTGVLAAVEIAARAGRQRSRVGAARGRRFGLGHDGGHEHARVPRRSAGRAGRDRGLRRAGRVRAWAPGPRRGRLADPPARDRRRRGASSASTSASTATATSCARSIPPKSSPRCTGRSSTPSTSRRSRSRSSGRSGTRCTSSRRSPRSRKRSRTYPAVSGAALHPAIREFERTTFALLNAYTPGAFAGIDDARRRARRTRACACRCCSCTPRAARSRSPKRGACRSGCAESGPAAGVSAAASVAGQPRSTNLVTCDMGGTQLRRVRRRARPARAPEPRRPHGGVDRAVADRRRVHRRGRRLASAGSTRAACCGSVRVGRRRARPGLLRAGRDRGHRHRRARGARLPRPGAVPRRRHGARRRRRERGVRTRGRAVGPRRATKPRGASVSSPSRAW